MNVEQLHGEEINTKCIIKRTNFSWFSFNENLLDSSAVQTAPDTDMCYRLITYEENLLSEM